MASNLKIYSEYAVRLMSQIDQSNPVILLGVSFGGLVAVEVAKRLNPIQTILISTVEIKKDLRKFYRVMGKTGLVNIIPSSFFIPPKALTDRYVGAKNKELLRAILDDTDPKFVKWAVRQLIRWQNNTAIKNTLKINGNNDLLMPHRMNRNQIFVEGGKHFIVVDQADEVSNIINKSLSNIS